MMETFEGLGESVPKPRLMPGGFFEFEVADVDAAVALATLFRDAGRYTYFRGQAKAEWHVRSSFARQDPAGRKAAISAIVAFVAWVRRSPELVPYLVDDDQIIAAAQHHGVCATTFTDLTTDPTVAGWFATDGGKAGEVGAVYLVDPDRLQPIFDSISSGGLVLRFVEVDVPNLWRLQAQSGLFLESTADLDQIWPLDRIVFRQNGTPGRIERGQIYPEQRSHLEQMIDQHRLLRQREDAMDALLAGGGIHAIDIGEAPDTAGATFGAPVRPEVWATGPDERWGAVDADSPAARWTPSRLREAAGDLKALVDRRRRATRLLTVDDAEPSVAGRLQAFLDCVWEGMRPYPYDASAIARAISSVTRLEVHFRDFNLGAGLGTMPVAKRVLVDPVEVEFGLHGGGASRACVSGARLLGALSEPARYHLGLTDDATGATVLSRLAPYWGRTLACFDQDRLQELFIDEIVPWQVVSKRAPIAFSSFHITTLGLP